MEDESRRTGDRVSYMSEVQLDYEGMKMTLNALDLSSEGVGVWGPAQCPAGSFKLSCVPLYCYAMQLLCYCYAIAHCHYLLLC